MYEEKFYLAFLAGILNSAVDDWVVLKKLLNDATENPELLSIQDWRHRVESSLLKINDFSEAAARERIPYSNLRHYQSLVSQTGQSGKKLVKVCRRYLKTGNSRMYAKLVEQSDSFHINIKAWVTKHKEDQLIRQQKAAASLLELGPKDSAIDMIKINRARHNALAINGEKWVRPEKEEAKYVTINGLHCIEVNGIIEYVLVSRTRIEKIDAKNRPEQDKP